MLLTLDIIQTILWTCVFSYSGFCIFRTLHCNGFPYWLCFQLRLGQVLRFLKVCYAQSSCSQMFFRNRSCLPLKACNLIEKRLQHSRFPVNIANSFFHRTPPLAASALNFASYFQVLNSGCTIWSREFYMKIHFIHL